jgi:hypothetical protein
MFLSDAFNINSSLQNIVAELVDSRFQKNRALYVFALPLPAGVRSKQRDRERAGGEIQRGDGQLR